MSLSQNNTNNWVVVNSAGTIVEGPATRESAEAKRQTLTESAGGETFTIKQLLTE